MTFFIKMSRAVLVRMNGDVVKVHADTRSEFAGDSPERFAAFVKVEAEKWRRWSRKTDQP